MAKHLADLDEEALGVARAELGKRLGHAGVRAAIEHLDGARAPGGLVSDGHRGRAQAGSAAALRLRDGEGPPVDGAMIAYDPPARLEMRSGDGETLRFDLRPDGYQLDGQQPPWTPVQRWRHVHESYVERFGPQAATIGPPQSHADTT